MIISKWNKKHQIVFYAVKSIFNKQDNLRKIYNKSSYFLYHQEQKIDDFLITYVHKVINILGEKAPHYLAQYFVCPSEHLLAENNKTEDILINQIASFLSGVYCQQYPSKITYKAIRIRLITILEDPYNASKKELNQRLKSKCLSEQYLYPKADTCIRVLHRHFQIEGVANFLKNIYQGKYNQLIDHGDGAYIRYENTNNILIGQETTVFDQLIIFLYEKNQFKYQWFNKAIRLYPGNVNSSWAFANPDTQFKNIKSELIKIYQTYLFDIIKSMLINLPKDKEVLEKIIANCHFQGIAWIKIGLELIQQEAISEEYRVSNILQKIISIHSLLENETEEDLFNTLSKFGERELLLILPYAKYSRKAILKSLGWNNLIQLDDYVFNISQQQCNLDTNIRDIIYNNHDFIDRTLLVKLLAPINKNQLNKYFDALNHAKHKFKQKLLLFWAVLGIERDIIEKKLLQLDQTAIKAYGLYPVENQAELKDRYIRLKNLYQYTAKLRKEHQLKTKDAVKIAIKNLAQSAGYPDDNYLERVIETYIYKKMIPFNKDFKVGAWSICLELNGISTNIKIRKQEKILNTIPSKVKKSPIYKTMYMDKEETNQQLFRFINKFENMMCHQNSIHKIELINLYQIPTAAAILSKLILKSESNDFGLFNEKTKNIIDINGATIPITTHLKIAHAYDLFEGGILTRWQQKFKQTRHFIQPFNQLFRKLYIKTSNERKNGKYSSRYAGDRINSIRANHRLNGRDWKPVRSNSLKAVKVFSTQQIYAEINFLNTGNLLLEKNQLTIGDISFHDKNGLIKLEKVCPIIFSEVLWDVDSITSYVQTGSKSHNYKDNNKLTTYFIDDQIKEIGLSV